MRLAIVFVVVFGCSFESAPWPDAKRRDTSRLLDAAELEQLDAAAQLDAGGALDSGRVVCRLLVCAGAGGAAGGGAAGGAGGWCGAWPCP